MESLEITKLRLWNQKITLPFHDEPSETVSWFGAMQAQDFAAAKWAVGLRTKRQTDVSVEQAFNEGKILRTHIMRPTWHFVHPLDIRWMLTLTAPRVQAFNGHYYRKSGFNKTIFKKSNEIIQKALYGGKQLTRNEINGLLQEAKIPTKDVGLSFAMMQAELEGIICSGPRLGKQFTYMLLDERVPQGKQIDLDESLIELTKRYFQSHGPAQIEDFVWWSGLTKTDAKKGLEMLGSAINNEELGGNTYWYFNTAISSSKYSPHDAFLLPGFDEYFIAYKNRHDILDNKYKKHLNMGGGMINGAIVIGGKMVGGWKRTFQNKGITLNLQLFEKTTDAQNKAINITVKRLGIFMNLPIVLKRDGVS